jgi:hypothetical protein
MPRTVAILFHFKIDSVIFTTTAIQATAVPELIPSLVGCEDVFYTRQSRNYFTKGEVKRTFSSCRVAWRGKFNSTVVTGTWM